MASRHLSRALVLQTLFEGDVSNTLNLADAKRILKRNASEFSLGDSDMAFADSLLTGILGKQSEIDAVLVKAAPQWPLDKIAPIDRNVLRIGLYELLFGDRAAVPPKVALNEAIEIGKSFGGDASGKFVNGVLGAVYRDIGEPQKADAPRPATQKTEVLGGAVVIAITPGGPQVALVLDAFKRWTLPKAHCEEGEVTQTAALRAIKNELGIDATIVAPLAEHTYRANEPEGSVEKTVAYFAASAEPSVTLQCIVCDGILEARWYTPDELGALPMYEDLRAIIDQGLTAITA